jgi:hypothetical protein
MGKPGLPLKPEIVVIIVFCPLFQISVDTEAFAALYESEFIRPETPHHVPVLFSTVITLS